MTRVLILLAATTTLTAQWKNFPSDSATLTPPEEIAIVKGGCDGEVSTNQYKATVCSACPEEYPGGWRLGAVHFGHFTSPTADQAFVEMIGCGTSTINQTSAMLIEKQNGDWHRERFYQQKLGGSCHRIARKDGRHLLVCQGGSIWSGELHESVYVLDFEKGDLLTRLIDTSNIAGMGCMAPRYQADEIDRVSFSDRNQDGLEDVTVFATTARGTISHKQREACPAEIQPSNLKKRTYQLVFYFNGEDFQPGPATAKALKEFQQ